MFKKYLSVFVVACSIIGNAANKEIKHRFLAVDESGRQLHLVDQITPKNSWTIKVKGGTRDSQLIGKGLLLLSHPSGYYEISIKDGSISKDFQKYSKVNSVIRTGNGSTFIGCNRNGITIYLLDKSDKQIKEINFPNLKNLRLMSLTSKKTILVTDGHGFAEVDLKGKIVRKVSIPGAKHVYKAVSLKNGQVFASAGYGGFIAVIDKAGKVVRKIGQDARDQGEVVGFFSDFQILKNSNIVVANWHGHGRSDSKKGSQLLQFDAKGNLVWKWHNPKLAGTIHGVIIIDGYDIRKLHDDHLGYLKPVKQK